MAEKRKKMRPVRAWAVVDGSGKVVELLLVRRSAAWLNPDESYIPVLITELTPSKKGKR